MERIPGKIHVFLTGERGIGKSSAVRRAAELDGRPCYGFLTRFGGPDRERAALYMVPPREPEAMDETHLVAFRADGRMQAVPGRFDALGGALLSEAREHPEGLILMDEIGFLEKDAAVFREEILRCLDGEIPVLGVLRKGQPWHGFITGHPKVRVIEVTADNRDKLPAAAAGELGKRKP